MNHSTRTYSNSGWHWLPCSVLAAIRFKHTTASASSDFTLLGSSTHSHLSPSPLTRFQLRLSFPPPRRLMSLSWWDRWLTGTLLLVFTCAVLMCSERVCAANQRCCAPESYNSSWTLSTSGRTQSLAGSVVDCSLAALECLVPGEPCLDSNLLVLDTASGAVLVNRSHGLNATHLLLEQYRSPPQLLSSTATAVYVGYMVGQQQQCAGTEIRRRHGAALWTASSGSSSGAGGCARS